MCTSALHWPKSNSFKSKDLLQGPVGFSLLLFGLIMFESFIVPHYCSLFELMHTWVLFVRAPKNFKAYSGRALAYEGLAEWDKAVLDYTRALEQAQLSTGSIEPYIANSRGNVFSSLGRYSEALQDYLLSLQVLTSFFLFGF